MIVFLSLLTLIYLAISSVIDIKTYSVYCVINYCYYAAIFAFTITEVLNLTNYNTKHTLIFLLAQVIFMVLIKGLFHICKIGAGDGDLLSVLVPYIMHLCKYNIISTIYFIIYTLFFALLIAAVIKGFKYIRKIKSDKLAFVPCISIGFYATIFYFYLF